MTDKRGRQRKVKGRAAIGVIPCPETSPMRLDDGAADGESHPQTIPLSRVERLKNFVEPIFTYADAPCCWRVVDGKAVRTPLKLGVRDEDDDWDRR